MTFQKWFTVIKGPARILSADFWNFTWKPHNVGMGWFRWGWWYFAKGNRDPKEAFPSRPIRSFGYSQGVTIQEISPKVVGSYADKGLVHQLDDLDPTPDIDPEDAGWCILCGKLTHGKCGCERIKR